MQNPFEVIAARLSNIESLLLDIKHRSVKSGKNETSIYTLDLSVRGLNILSTEGIETVEQLLKLTDRQIMCFRGLGRKTYIEIKNELIKYK